MRVPLPPVVALVLGSLLPTLAVVLPVVPTAFPPPTSHAFTIINKQTIGNQIGSQVFASCLVRTTGGTCTIAKGKSVARQVQVTFGMTWSAATAQLGISSATTVTTTVSCTSPALEVGATWKARSIGTKYFYNIRDDTVQAGHVIGTRTSARLTAFNPSNAHIACGLQ